MRELSLHILDIVQNSIAAEASRVDVSVTADTDDDKLTIRITDNGKGMDPDFAARITDPFVTTRRTRKVGLGIPMLMAAAELCGGTVSVQSELGKGTSTEAVFGLSHIDRAPMGDIVTTIVTVIAANPEIRLVYEHKVDRREFVLDTEEVRQQLDDVPINDPMVVQWLREHMMEGISTVGAVA